MRFCTESRFCSWWARPCRLELDACVLAGEITSACGKFFWAVGRPAGKHLGLCELDVLQIDQCSMCVFARCVQGKSEEADGLYTPCFLLARRATTFCDRALLRPLDQQCFSQLLKVLCVCAKLGQSVTKGQAVSCSVLGELTLGLAGRVRSHLTLLSSVAFRVGPLRGAWQSRMCHRRTHAWQRLGTYGITGRFLFPLLCGDLRGSGVRLLPSQCCTAKIRGCK